MLTYVKFLKKNAMMMTNITSNHFIKQLKMKRKCERNKNKKKHFVLKILVNNCRFHQKQKKNSQMWAIKYNNYKNPSTQNAVRENNLQIQRPNKWSKKQKKFVSFRSVVAKRLKMFFCLQRYNTHCKPKGLQKRKGTTSCKVPIMPTN